MFEKRDSDSAESLSLIKLLPAIGTYRSDERLGFIDDLSARLTATPPMRRLAEIGFLGALDFVCRGSGRAPHRRRHDRLEHSLGVAHLAQTYALLTGLSERERLTIVAAALLHDVGHGPLSHTLEPVFEAEFGINHHIVTRQILRGETVWGDEIKEILQGAGIDVDQVLSLVSGEHGEDRLGILFSGQINIDTLEGITRCRAFAGRRHAYLSAHSIVQKWAMNSDMPCKEFDAFWELKNSVYNVFIGSPKGAALDAIAQAYMRSNRTSFAGSDFMTTERTFRKRHRRLFDLLDKAGKSSPDFRSELPQDWLKQEVTLKRRSFVVHREVPLDGNGSINRRYRQSRSQLTVRLSNLFGETL